MRPAAANSLLRRAPRGCQLDARTSQTLSITSSQTAAELAWLAPIDPRDGCNGEAGRAEELRPREAEGFDEARRQRIVSSSHVRACLKELNTSHPTAVNTSGRLQRHVMLDGPSHNP